MVEIPQGMLAKLAPYLMGAGAGLLSNRGQLSGLGPGLLQGGELAQQQMLNRLRIQQEERQKIEQAQKDEMFARQQKQAMAQDAFLAGLPPEQQAMGQAIGGGPMAAAQFEQMNRPPEGAQSSAGKLASDLARGLITKRDYDAIIKKQTYIAPVAAGGENTGPFAGTGMSAQATNLYIDLEKKKGSGQPLTQDESMLHALVKRQLEAPRVVQGEDGVNYFAPAAPLPGYGNDQPPPQSDSTSAPQPAVPGVTPKLTDEQAKSAGYYERAQEASGIIESVTETSNPYALMTKGIAESPPLIGPLLGAGVNATMSPETQKMGQAQRDFVNAVLRKESGAVINPDEFRNAQQQYFPQSGDGPKVKAQKKANRELKIKALLRESGKWGLGKDDSASPKGNASPSKDDGWTTLPNGIRIREKK